MRGGTAGAGPPDWPPSGSTVGGYHPPVPAPAGVEEAGGAHTVDLATSYELCRRLTAVHARTYYFALRFLPRRQRGHVHALYAFARYADDLVDHLEPDLTGEQRRLALEAWSTELLEALRAGRSSDPLLMAVIDTVTRLGIAHEDLHAFLRSMAMDLTVTRYATYEDLCEYVHGSAEVIGSMMLPVLGVEDTRARQPAMALGAAFQLTNFLRDVAEDWDRGRLYLPLEDLERFDVTEWDFESRHVGDPMRRLLAFEAARARELYARAEAGFSLLPSQARPCIRIAHRLYGEILDRLEACDWQVFRHRASVPVSRKARAGVRELARHAAPWQGGGRVRTSVNSIEYPHVCSSTGETGRASVAQPLGARMEA